MCAAPPWEVRGGRLLLCLFPKAEWHPGLVCMEKWAREPRCEEILATLVAQSLLLWAAGASEFSAVFLS